MYIRYVKKETPQGEGGLGLEERTSKPYQCLQAQPFLIGDSSQPRRRRRRVSLPIKTNFFRIFFGRLHDVPHANKAHEDGVGRGGSTLDISPIELLLFMGTTSRELPGNL